MTTPPNTRRAADHLVDQLVAQGATDVFGVPGESFLPVLDALHEHDAIRFLTCRQEGGAAMAAEAHGKLTGRPGICMIAVPTLIFLVWASIQEALDTASLP